MSWFLGCSFVLFFDVFLKFLVCIPLKKKKEQNFQLDSLLKFVDLLLALE